MFLLSQDQIELLRPWGSPVCVSSRMTVDDLSVSESISILVPLRLWDRLRYSSATNKTQREVCAYPLSVQDMTSQWPVVCRPDLTQHSEFLLILSVKAPHLHLRLDLLSCLVWVILLIISCWPSYWWVTVNLFQLCGNAKAVVCLETCKKSGAFDWFYFYLTKMVAWD